MPNWCNNLVTIRPIDESEDAKKQFKEFKELLEVKDDGIADNIFNKLVPRPKDLDITSGGTVDKAKAIILSLEHNDHTEIDKIMGYPWVKGEADIKTREDLIIHLTTGDNAGIDLEEGRKAISNIKKYGFQDWYKWNVATWGTKWDISDIGIAKNEENELILNYATAWAPALQIYHTANQEKFDLLYFEIEYEESGVGFEGTCIIEDGDFSNDEREYDYSKDDEEEENY